MFRLGEWTVDPTTRRLRRGSDAARLSPKAMGVLIALHDAQGQVLSRRTLLDAVWPDVTVGEEVLTHAVAELRKALGDSTRQPHYIETVPKRGYRLIAEQVSTAEPGKVLDLRSYAASLGKREVRSLYHGSASAQPQLALDPSLYPERRSPDRPSIAVLAFANLSGDPGQEYFADGMTEDIITDLSRFRSLAVIARHTSFSFKGRAVTAQQVGLELGVDYVLEGSLRRIGETLRVTAQLTDTSSAHHIWAERYDREAEDVFAVQDDVVRNIVATLRQRVEGFDLERAQRKGTDNLSAYEHVLRGRVHYERMTAAEDLAALRNFERAIEIDPNYALAHAYLARVYTDAFSFAWAREPEVALERAIETANKAVSLDGSDSFAHATLGSTTLFKKQHRRAAKAFDKAVALNPNDADTLVQRSFLAEAFGQADESLSWMDKALNLSPFAPEWYVWCYIRCYYLARRYEDVVTAIDDMERPPYEALGLAAASHAWLGRDEDAKGLVLRFHAAAQGEMARYPGDDPSGWRAYWDNAFPYKEKGDLDHLFEGLSRAGFSI